MTSPYSSGPVFGYANVTGYRAIDALIAWGFRWGAGGTGSAATVTYSFPSYGAAWIGDYLSGEPFDGFRPFTNAQKTAARNALAAWSEVANIDFVEVADTPSNVGDIRFGNSAVVTKSGAAAWGYLPYRDSHFQYPESGDVWFDKSYPLNMLFGHGSFGYMAMLHEIGHAIGLDHPFAEEPGEIALPKALDNQRYSIMSYTPYSGAFIEAYGPMLYDILALQYIYGANMTTRTGDDVYRFEWAKEYLECIWDAGGHDTIDAHAHTVNQVINLQAGSFSSIGVRSDMRAAIGNVSIAFNVTIEDAIGGRGHDMIGGNAADNRLKGEQGRDRINGGEGDDRLEGDSAADVLRGGAGDDMLIGGSGNDTMEGGVGNDTYYVDTSNDVVSETGAGIDTVYASANITLYAGVENLTLTGSAIRGTGNNLANTIVGNASANILDGKGGADLLKGGAGNDTYIVDDAGDVVDEGANTDLDDVVKTSLQVATAINGIERYVYIGASAWTFTGNGVANTVTGGALNDTLDGAGGNDRLIGGGGNDLLIGGAGDDWLDGGTGDDELKGGAGNDTYVMDSAGDVIDEEGNTDSGDLVRTFFNVDLTTFAGGQIESAVLLGSAALSAVGNAAANQLTANDSGSYLDGGVGADTLTGGLGKDTLLGGSDDDWLDGGGGNDQLKGGAGNDTYVIDASGDLIDEEGNTDTDDLVRSFLNVDLTTLAGGQIEHAVLLGTAILSAIGNGGANRLTANDGSNYLDGGSGADTLTGGLGKDVLVGGLDDDSLDGGAGHDKLDGEDGNDTLVGNSGNDTLIGGLGDDYLDGGLGADMLKGGAGNDTYVLDGGTVIDEEGNNDSSDRVLSSVDVDLATLAGGKIEHATLLGIWFLNATGNAADNELIGNANTNVLIGGDGADTLQGGGGYDRLQGGDGIDILTGGQDPDRFEFNLLSEAGDIITDFVTGVGGDILDLSDLLDSFGYGGADPFGDGFLSFVQSGGNTIVKVDADGSGIGGTTDLATLLGATLTAANIHNYVV